MSFSINNLEILIIIWVKGVAHKGLNKNELLEEMDQESEGGVKGEEDPVSIILPIGEELSRNSGWPLFGWRFGI